MKYIYVILFALLLVGVDYAQLSTPTYTTNYRYRKYTQGANAGADSLNQNWIDIDGDIKDISDSAAAKFNLYGIQFISSGEKLFQGTSIISMNGGRFYFGASAQTTGAILGELFPLPSRTALAFYSNTGVDTLASLADVRSGAGGYAQLSGSVFTGDVSMGADVRTPRGAVTAGSSTITADNESFLFITTSAAPQEIATINGGSDGKILYLMSNDGSYTITMQDGVGNLLLAGDFVMSQYDTMTLIYDSSHSKWIELSRSNN